MPSCPARSESPELAAAFRVEMPRHGPIDGQISQRHELETDRRAK